MLWPAFRPWVKVLIAARLLSIPCRTLLIDRTTEHPDNAPTSTSAAVTARAVPALGNMILPPRSACRIRPFFGYPVREAAPPPSVGWTAGTTRESSGPPQVS